MSNSITTKTLDNGLTIILEEMSDLKSVAYSLMIPTGYIYDGNDKIGASILLTELTSRGAGNRDTKALSNAFDDLGVRHSEGAGQYYTTYRGSLLSENITEALALVADMVQRPKLPEAEIDNVRSLMLQDIQSMYDNPSRRVMTELGKLYYPDPFGRSSLGEVDGIKNTKLSDLKQIFDTRYSPNGAILSIAGNINAKAVLASAENLFGSWKGERIEIPAFGKWPERKMHHIGTDSSQLQIAVAYPSVKFGEDQYYVARVTAGLFSGGMFGRLFIEVREKRGLCYSVYLSHSASGLSGANVVYAGTTTERAQETLDVIFDELGRLKGTVSDEELARSKANIKSSLVMSEESSGSRAVSNSIDWWWLKRIRTLDEIQGAIESVTTNDIDKYLEDFPVGMPMIVTLGSKSLEFKGA